MTELRPPSQSSAPRPLQALLICFFLEGGKEGSVTLSLPQPFHAGPPAGRRRRRLAHSALSANCSLKSINELPFTSPPPRTAQRPYFCLVRRPAVATEKPVAPSSPSSTKSCTGLGSEGSSLTWRPKSLILPRGTLPPLASTPRPHLAHALLGTYNFSSK